MTNTSRCGGLLFVLGTLLLIVACGSGGNNGRSNSPTITSVAASCSPSTIQSGQTSQCSASVTGTGSFSSLVTWTASLGSISPSGLFTAPVVTSSTMVTITATSTQDSSKSGTAIVTVLPVSDPAYQELTNRVTANVTNFFVYQDQDSGFNHGFPSGFFGTGGAVTIDTGCLDNPADMMTGCYPSNDMTHLDRTRGTVLRVTFPSQSGDSYTGLNIEEPQQWGIYMDGVGYDLSPAAQVMFDVRSPTGISLQFGVGGCETNFIFIPQSSNYATMTIPLNSLVNGTHARQMCPTPIYSSR